VWIFNGPTCGGGWGVGGGGGGFTFTLNGHALTSGGSLNLVPADLGTITGTGSIVLSAGPALTGVPTAPTATVGTNTTQIATTAFVIANAGGGGFTFTLNGHALTTGGSLNLVPADLATVTGTGSLVESDSAALTGTPTAPTATVGTNTTQLATTAFVQAAVTAAGGGFTLGTTPITLGTTVGTVAGLTLAGPTTTGQLKTTGATNGVAWLDAYRDVNAAGIYTEWTIPTWSTLVSNRSYSLAGSGNIFQFVSALSSTGTMNATALYGSARSKSSGSGVWALNTTAACDSPGGSCVSYEADISNTVPGFANSIGILVSTSRNSCDPTSGSCHPQAAYQVNTFVVAGDLGHGNTNTAWIPSFNYGSVYGSAQYVSGGNTYNAPAVTGTLIRACCYNSQYVSGTIIQSVGGIDFTTASFSSFEISTSNFLAGTTTDNVATRVSVQGAVSGSTVRPAILVNRISGSETTKGLDIAGIGTGLIRFGAIGTQTGVCIAPNGSSSAPTLGSCGTGANIALNISSTGNAGITFTNPLGFPQYAVSALPACPSVAAVGWRVYTVDGNVNNR
jgi:hypothetical protein